MKRGRRRRSVAAAPKRRERSSSSERKNPVVEAARRVRILRWVALAACAVLVMRLGWLEVVQREHWQREAELTRTRRVALNAPRGCIFDRTGATIANNRRAWDLEVDLSRLLDRGRCAPLALSLFLRHIDRAAGRPDVAIDDVMASPAPFVDRLIALPTHELRAVSSAVERLQLQEWGRGLLLDSGATQRSLAAVRDALAGEGEGSLGALLSLDRTILLAHLQSWCERLQVLERCVSQAPPDGLGQFFEDAEKQCAAYVAARIAQELGTSEVPTPAEIESLELKSRLEWWRRARQRARVWVRDLEYDPAIFFLAQHADAFPGFEPQLRLRRQYESDMAFALIGTVASPTDGEREAWEEQRQRWMELRRLLQRSDGEQAELEALQESLGIDLLSPTEIRGQMGLELYYEEVLRGKRGLRRAEWDGFLDRPRSEESVVEIDPIPGDDLHLTLDRELQRTAEDLLRRAPTFVVQSPKVVLDEKFISHPRGALVVIAAHSGEVITAASWPSPTRAEVRAHYLQLAEEHPGRPLFPRAFKPWNVPQPGSVFKTFVALSVIDELGASPAEALPCGGSYEGQRCDNHKDDWADLTLALVKSCNCYFYRRGEQLGGPALDAMSKRFGFGEKTGIELRNELAGQLGSAVAPFPEAAEGAALRSFAIGQVVPHTTPLQIARAYAGVATGAIPSLHLISEIGAEVVATPAPRPLGYSDAALSFVRNALGRTVDQGTAHGLAQLPWTVAGKTGTAENWDDEPDHSWFAGWLPREAPRWVIVVYCERAGVHGGDLAVPIARAFLESPEWARFMKREAHP